MAGAGITLVILLLVLALLLAIPVACMIHAERNIALQTSWRVRWLFGLVEVGSGRRRAQPPAPPGRDESEAAAVPSRRFPRSNPGKGGKMVLAALGTRGVVPRLRRLVIDLLRQLHWENLSLHLEFGFDDPADTGRIYGLLYPLLVAVAGTGIELRCEPDFGRPCLEGSFEAAFRLRPVAIIGIVLVFFCSPPVVRAMHAGWRAKR
jgi:hypothetical protein